MSGGMRAAIRSLAACSLVVVTGCLPVPHYVTEVVEVSGIVLIGEKPAHGMLVSVQQPPNARGMAACSGATPVTTDSSGRFRSSERRTFRLLLVLFALPKTEIPLQVCVRQGDSWQPAYLARIDAGRGGIELVCNLAGSAYADRQTGEKGLCVRGRAPDAGPPPGRNSGT